MTRSRHPQRVLIFQAMLAFTSCLLTGCISGSLASTTGPPFAGTMWSDVPQQMVYVGEEVRFDFVLQDAMRRFVVPVGIADYCVYHIDGRRSDVEMDGKGRFRLTHTFDGVRPGDRVLVRAQAFWQVGDRDYMRIGGKWVRSDSPLNDPDRPVAQDHIEFVVYDRLIELRLVRPADDLVEESGVLRIRRDDGTIKSVFVNRPHRRGFTLTPPGPDGYYHVRYVPDGSDLNPAGKTEVEFEIHDQANNLHRTGVTLDTP